MPSTYTPRVWERINPRTDHSYLTPAVRVQRERLLFLEPGKQFMYEVHIKGETRWIRMHSMIAHASVAFDRAGQYVNREAVAS